MIFISKAPRRPGLWSGDGLTWAGELQSCRTKVVLGSAVILETPAACSAPSPQLGSHLTQGCTRTQGMFFKAHSGEWFHLADLPLAKRVRLCGCFKTGVAESFLQYQRSHARQGGAGLSAPLSLNDMGCHVHHLWERKAGCRRAA